MEDLRKKVLTAAQKKFERVQHKDIYLLGQKYKIKQNLNLPLIW